MRRNWLGLVLASVLFLGVMTPPAAADFPYPEQNRRHLNPGEYDPEDNPNDIRRGGEIDVHDDRPPTQRGGDKEYWEYSSKDACQLYVTEYHAEKGPDAPPHPKADNCSPATKANPKELMGVTGASIDRAWETTTGEPEVIIAVHDSGIDWDDVEAMRNLNNKTWLNRGEFPVDAQGDDNGDGIFNIEDFCSDWDGPAACEDPRARDLNANGIVDPEDLIFEFSDGIDDDGNGYVDDFVGWDSFEDDNDPYDEVHYGHGTGEAEDSTAEVNNDVGMAGVCPNCMVMHMRVGDSFIADVNNFAQGAVYAVDNGASVLQSALGTLNNSRFAQEAIDYAYRRGVSLIASAADESAGHHNQPSVLEHAITMNSSGEPQSLESEPPPQPPTYLEFRGCTNYGAYITATVPSNSCSSEAVGRSAGMTGLVYSAARNAADESRDDALLPTDRKCVLEDYSSLGGDDNLVTEGRVLSAEEIDQLISTTADDYDFTGYTARSLPETERYPATSDWDPFFGYGRINARRMVEAVDDCKIPPEADITSPRWFEIEDTTGPISIRGRVASMRTPAYSYKVEWAVWSWKDEPIPPVWNSAGVTQTDAGTRSAPLTGELATIDPAVIAGQMTALNGPPGPTGPPVDPVTGRGDHENRQIPDKFSVIVRIVATARNSAGEVITSPYVAAEGGGDPNVDAEAPLVGVGTKNFYLHDDPALMTGYPTDLEGDGGASPRFVDLDDDGRDEMVVATSNGEIHAFEYDHPSNPDCEGRPSPCEVPGWPVTTSDYDLNYEADAYQSGEITTPVHASVLRSPAIGDLDRDGDVEVVTGDFQGNLFAFDQDGNVLDGFPVRSNPVFSSPQRPDREAGFYAQHPELVPGHYPGPEPLPNDPDLVPDLVNRHDKMNRQIWWWMAAPSLGNIDGDDALEIVAGAADRHIYAFEHNGEEVPGWPVMLRDPAKIDVIDDSPTAENPDGNGPDAIDPVTHELTERDEDDRFHGAKVINSVALGNIDGLNEADGEPPDLEIVATVNEQYRETMNSDDPTIGNLCSVGFPHPISDEEGPTFSALGTCGNQRIYALRKEGSRTSRLKHPDSDAYIDGWPARIGTVTLELLPVVGNGPDGAPIIGNVTADKSLEIGIFSTAGPGYILDHQGESIYGRDERRRYRTLLTDAYGPETNSPDNPTVPAVGGAIFSTVGPGLLTFVAPSAGLGKLVDVLLPEDQIVSDNHVSMWVTSTPEEGLPGPRDQAPAFPREVNDLQFLATPASADINGDGRQEILEGTAYSDLHAFDGVTGDEPGMRTLAPDGWPKFTGGWTVTPPAVGDFDDDGSRDVGHVIREGRLFVWRGNGADVCDAATWPDYGHDAWNSNNVHTDAIRPRVITDLTTRPGAPDELELTWTAPGDDGTCGKAHSYEIRVSPEPLTNENFDSALLVARQLAGEPGTQEHYEIGCGGPLFAAVRTWDRPPAADDAVRPANPSAVSNNVVVTHACTGVVVPPTPDPDPTGEETPSPSPSGSTGSPSPTATETPRDPVVTTTISVDEDKVDYRTRFTISGRVDDDGCSGTPRIAVEKRVHGRGRSRRVGTPSVGNDGRWSLGLVSSRNAGYSAHVEADGCLGSSSDEVDVLVRVAIRIAEIDCPSGVITGRVQPRHRGTKVVLERRARGRWRKVGSDRVNARSRFELSGGRCRSLYRIVWPEQSRDNIRKSRRVRL